MVGITWMQLILILATSGIITLVVLIVLIARDRSS